MSSSWRFEFPHRGNRTAAQGKALLRALARRRLPGAVWQLPKKGFTAPIGDWIGGLNAPMFRDEVLQPNAAIASALHTGELARRFEAHQAGHRDHSYTLWAVWVLERWLQKEKADSRSRRVGSECRSIRSCMFMRLWADVREMVLEQFEYRELLYQMTLRDLLLRYKQTVMGFGWAVFMPLVNTAVFSVIFTRVATLETPVPYPVFAFCGLWVWNFFAATLRFSVTSLSSNPALVSKVYFPREIFPFSAVIVGLVDFAVGSLVLVALMLWYQVPFGMHLFWLPVVIAVHVSFTAAVALILSMANLFYRDIKYLFEIVITVWMFATSVVYPVDRIGGKLGSVLRLNPMTPIVDAYRAVFLFDTAPPALFGATAVASVARLALRLARVPPLGIRVRRECLTWHPRYVFDNVSKKFRRGERHDSLRDLVPSLVRRALRERRPDALDTEEFWALRNVSFEVAPGEALGIIGANGAGKSTTLKVLTKILKPTIGRCAVTGRIGALIEVAAGFHPDLTGRENVFLQGAIMGMKRLEIAERFDEIVDFAGVADFIDTPVKRYSSGMNARLGFSIAAHLRPDVLIIDEVLSVGDMAFQQKCFERMLAYKRRGIAIVLVSHNLQAVASLCDRAVLLAGHVVSAGPTADVLGVYVQASQVTATGATGPIEVLSVSIASGDDKEGAHLDVVSGTHMRLRIVARSQQPLDDVTFGLVVHRSSDQLLVYDGNVHRQEIGDSSDFSGDFSLDLWFRASLVRGHYYVSWHIYSNPTQCYILPKRQVATLTVHEDRSQSGVADLEMSATLNAQSAAMRQPKKKERILNSRVGT